MPAVSEGMSIQAVIRNGCFMFALSSQRGGVWPMTSSSEPGLSSSSLYGDILTRVGVTYISKPAGCDIITALLHSKYGEFDALLEKCPRCDETTGDFQTCSQVT